ncbi:MAG: hypothetical protein IJ443_04150, partial [Firmicutes bacterium]|nr:hypothetical protein [Bacillota bacterium]
MKKKLSFLLIFTLILTLLVPSAAFAEDETAGTAVGTTDTVYNGFYNETADLAASLIARYNAGAMNA